MLQQMLSVNTQDLIQLGVLDEEHFQSSAGKQTLVKPETGMFNVMHVEDLFVLNTVQI